MGTIPFQAMPPPGLPTKNKLNKVGNIDLYFFLLSLIVTVTLNLKGLNVVKLDFMLCLLLYPKPSRLDV